MSNFAASLAAEKTNARVTRAPYPPGVAGVKMTLEYMAQLIRDGSKSASVQGWAGDQLHQAGITGRAKSDTNFKKAKVLLDAIRKVTVYTPDPPMTEMVKAAEIQLCLRPGMCIRGSDCDDLSTLTGAVLASIGIPVRILKQTFSAGEQEHVLLEAQEEDGSWFALDPSTNLPCGKKAYAEDEFRVDPFNPKLMGLQGAPVDGEFVGMGKTCGDTCCSAKPCSGCASKSKKLPTRYVGAVPASQTLYAQAAADLTNQVMTVIQAGDTYRSAGQWRDAIHSYQAAGMAGATGVGPEIDLVGAANATQPFTQKAWDLNQNLNAGVTIQPTESNVAYARNLVSQMVGYYVAAIQAGQAALAKTGGSLTVPGGGMSLLEAGGWTLGGAAVAYWLFSPKRRRRR